MSDFMTISNKHTAAMFSQPLAAARRHFLLPLPAARHHFLLPLPGAVVLQEVSSK